ncbi:MAG: bifunctional folylpolyglutamate synthase/dihydrofolate synthase [Synechococcus sp. SB0673_bin_10]|nr:bifunctional folylpolyglutamate synthase/dihydrofolate synthase [Synechococcus sp. SB0673_bin_10]
MGDAAECPCGKSSGWPAPVDLSDLLPGQTNGVVAMGLERVKGALNALGNPQNSFVAIQVAGTNGKGSICSLLHGALAAHGLRSGLYTSPHLVSWCERIRVGQAFITPTTLRALLVELRPLAQQWSLTPFEQLTVAAFLHFHRQAVDLAVLEVGLGGRLDATTAHCRRSTVAFAAIGEDHQEYLGPNLASIAREKAGVLSPGCVAFSGPQPAAVVPVLRQAAAACGATITWVPPLAGDKFRGLNLPLRGPVQQHNAAVAMAVLEHVSATMHPLDLQRSRKGMASVCWPGRLQHCHWQGHPLLLDGAHNRSAALCLRQHLDDKPSVGSIHWVLGILANKDAIGMLRALLRPGDRAWLVAIAESPCWSADQLVKQLPAAQAACLQLAPPHLGCTWPVPVALGQAFHQPPGSEACVVVSGSLYLLGQLHHQGVIQVVKQN